MMRLGPKRRIVLINPNTDAAITTAMLEMARRFAPAPIALQGVTAARGSALIIDPAALSIAAEAVGEIVAGLKPCDGVIVSAFGDPGLKLARRVLACPVTGLAEASMAHAAVGGRRFCVVTTTPALASTIDDAARAYGHGASYVGTFCTPGDPMVMMRDPALLPIALLETCERVIAAQGVEAIIIGGGPLAAAARTISGRVAIPVIEPLRAAMETLAAAMSLQEP
ncbi:aspartate/glutamate racemase family protein [Aureimonas altamirensis]|uniref:aspartate/glutamate racemase family protein n=1 Tax=Aureimonas altamirensis TaxID=370622 RepID=UPI001E5A236D|nr:aspartate/glutamate racemase family protein [Aureimonas altamirensis]UHD43798.1 aspartate/glutamate racemase family protein [Aureimonas altamirensis]